MKIEYRRMGENHPNFTDLLPGDCFVVDGIGYVKVQSVVFKDDTYNAVSIEDGSFRYFGYEQGFEAVQNLILEV